MKILHMYPDVMNLYGEYANVRVLKEYLNCCGQVVSVDSISLSESKDIRGYDFYYMGAGTEKNQRLVMADMMKFKDDLKAEYEAGKVMLFTGNAMDILGDHIRDVDGNETPGLGLFRYYSLEQKFRINGDVVAEVFGSLENGGWTLRVDGAGSPPLRVVGFVNRCTYTLYIDEPWLEIKLGYGDLPPDCMKDAAYYGNKNCEGVHSKNLFGTHLTGPLMVKNPYVMKLMAKLLMQNEGLSDKNIEDLILKHSFKEQEAGYEVTLKALLERIP